MTDRKNIFSLSNAEKNILDYGLLAIAILILFAPVETSLAIYAPIGIATAIIALRRLYTKYNNATTQEKGPSTGGYESNDTDIDDETYNKYMQGELTEAEFEAEVEQQLQEQQTATNVQPSEQSSSTDADTRSTEDRIKEIKHRMDS